MNKDFPYIKFPLSPQIFLVVILAAVFFSGCQKLSEGFDKGFEQGKRQSEQEANTNSGAAEAEPSPRPTPVSLSAESLKNDETNSLSGMKWMYQPGDNMSWAGAEIDDSGWETVVPGELVGFMPPKSGWNGIGWFRLPVTVDESLAGQPLGLTVSHPGASEIYVDGKLMQSFGKVSVDQTEEETYNPKLTPVGISFAESGEHIIAIRYSNTSAKKHALEPFGFEIKLAPLNSTIVNTLEETALIKSVKGGIFGICLALGLLHLLLFILYPRQSANLFYSLFLLAEAANVVVTEMFLSHTGAGASILNMMVGIFFESIYFVAFTAYLYTVLENRIPRYLRIMGILWLAALLLTVIAYLEINIILSTVSTIIGLLVLLVLIIWHIVIVSIVIVRAVLRKVDNSWILGVVGVSFLVSSLSSWVLVIVLGENSRYLFISQFIFLTALIIANAVFLARQFARTSTDLEKQLVKEIEHEKERARLTIVEAENDRRAKELEEARQLQLSMLPKKLPNIAGLEIAAYMKPATEVGGDYYDFHVGKDGTLTVAVGDATGHGLKAGTMVAVTKGLFNNLADASDIPNTFKQISQSLKAMNLRGLFMAMTMLKIKDNQVILSSAGMPSTLVYRSGTNLIENFPIKAMPLGSMVNFPYDAQNFAMTAGDCIIVMSDGFPEMFNAENEMIGFEKAGELLPEIADKSPQEIINHFVETAEKWAGTRPADDDVTFVVLKAVK